MKDESPRAAATRAASGETRGSPHAAPPCRGPQSGRTQTRALLASLLGPIGSASARLLRLPPATSTATRSDGRATTVHVYLRVVIILLFIGELQHVMTQSVKVSYYHGPARALTPPPALRESGSAAPGLTASTPSTRSRVPGRGGHSIVASEVNLSRHDRSYAVPDIICAITIHLFVVAQMRDGTLALILSLNSETLRSRVPDPRPSRPALQTSPRTTAPLKHAQDAIP